jgi:hypothetical protein
MALAFLGEQTGFYFSFLNRLCGIFLLVIYLTAHSKNQDLDEQSPKTLLAVRRILIIFLALIAPLPAISIGTALLLSLNMGGKKRTPEFQVGLIFFAYVLLHSFVPHFFLLERAIADGFNMFLRSITGLPINYSPDAYGFGCLLIIVSFTIIEVLRLPKTKIQWVKKTILVLSLFAGYFLWYISYFLLSTKYYQMPPPTGTGFDNFLYYFLSLFLPMNGQGILLIILFSFIVLIRYFMIGNQYFSMNSENDKLNHSGYLFKTTVIILFSLILVSFYANIDIYKDHIRKPKIVFYDTGMDFSTVPDDKVFGMYNGLFGLMTSYLKDWGYEVETRLDWHRIEPQNHDILILVNPHGHMQPKEKENIKSFVRKGGSLFFLGDHTDMFGLHNDYFKMIKELGIAFNFDTALFFRHIWRKSLTSPYVTWDRMIKRDNFTPFITQGASLAIKYPASPLIIGQYGWSDPGNLKNKPGYLGNRKYETNKPTGDVVLAAERKYGQGKILVFGDTSFLQNSPISIAYPMIELCLSHLLSKKIALVRFLIPCFFMLAAFFLLVGGKIFKLTSGAFIPVMILLIISLIWLGFFIGSDQKFFNLPSRTKFLRAGIDKTFFPDFYQDDWESFDRNIGGLKNTIYRANVLPYLIYQSDNRQLGKLDYLFILAPNKKITPTEAQKIIGFVRKGGLLVVAGGFEHREQLLEILMHLQIDIQNTPLSFLSEKDNTSGIRFVSAWPLINVGRKDFKVLCADLYNNPLIVELNEGKGKLIFVGDSYFFENRNLEKKFSYYKSNYEFVKQLLISIQK